MKSRMPWLIGVLCCVLLASAMPAIAKSISMRPLSRNAVDTACSHARGSSFGTHDADGSYGCSSDGGSVECTADGACFGYVSDLLQMPTNSLDAVLGARVSGQPIKIGPTEKRIMPLAQP